MYNQMGKAELEAYCVKCKAKRKMKDYELVQLKNKKRTTYAAKGKCHVCGTKMFRILSKDQYDALKAGKPLPKSKGKK